MCIKVIKVSDDSYKSKKEVENESANTDLSKKFYVISNSFTHCLVCFQTQSDVIFNENHHMVNRKKLHYNLISSLSNLFGNPLNNEFHLSTELWGINEKIRHCRKSKLEL